METCYVCICDKSIGGGGEGFKDGACNVGYKVKAAMNRLLSKDGDFVDVGLGHGENSGGRKCEPRVDISVLE
jgi:hypothetical protein